MQLNFNVRNWSAWSSRRPGKEHWQAWAEGRASEAEAGAPDLSAVPAMQRRRMSAATRMAVSTAIDCVGESRAEPVCIFATRHGESERTIKIINSIGEGKPVSPTDFSLSVHNTALGLYSIFSANRLPATTVVSNQEVFDAALIETAIHQNRFPNRDILLVVYDAPPPAPISTLNVGPEEAYSVALLLSPGEGQAIACSRGAVEEGMGDPVAERNSLVFEFLRFLLFHDHAAVASAGNCRWNWAKVG